MNYEEEKNTIAVTTSEWILYDFVIQSPICSYIVSKRLDIFQQNFYSEIWSKQTYIHIFLKIILLFGRFSFQIMTSSFVDCHFGQFIFFAVFFILFLFLVCISISMFHLILHSNSNCFSTLKSFLNEIWIAYNGDTQCMKWPNN